MTADSVRTLRARCRHVSKQDTVSDYTLAIPSTVLAVMINAMQIAQSHPSLPGVISSAAESI